MSKIFILPPQNEDEQESPKEQQVHSPLKSQQSRNPLADYKMINEIGQGSFGKVYKARKLVDTSDKYYAIKRIKLQALEQYMKYSLITLNKQLYSQEMKNHQIFMEKLQIYFDFPGINKMHSCFNFQGSIFFVMDYASGGPFEQFLRFNSG